MRVLQVAHGGEGDVDHAVDVVISLLHLGAQNADDFEAQTIQADVFAQRIASGEEFFLRFRADHRDARVLHLVFRVVEAALRQFQDADGKHIGIIAGDR